MEIPNRFVVTVSESREFSASVEAETFEEAVEKVKRGSRRILKNARADISAYEMLVAVPDIRIDVTRNS